MAETTHHDSDDRHAEDGHRNERINIHDVQELRRWTKALGVSSDALVSAVRAVGHDAESVEAYLRERRAS